MKREAKITPLITAYIKIKKLYGFFEVKQTRTKNFNLSNFEPQQLDSLVSACHNGLVYKLSDSDQRIKPFDIISSPPGSAYVVICYPKEIIFVGAFNIILMKKNGAKSLSHENAKKISIYRIDLA
jgi:hypothetical protein